MEITAPVAGILPDLGFAAVCVETSLFRLSSSSSAYRRICLSRSSLGGVPSQHVSEARAILAYSRELAVTSDPPTGLIRLDERHYALICSSSACSPSVSAKLRHDRFPSMLVTICFPQKLAIIDRFPCIWSPPAISAPIPRLIWIDRAPPLTPPRLLPAPPPPVPRRPARARPEALAEHGGGAPRLP